MSLLRYRAKRNFSRTTEPRGAARVSRRRVAPSPSRILFVVQKHAASRLHYDFRLEVEGVLKSWAVPKGIPLAKGSKSLAVQVEDHPAEYGGFEGVIPEGNYGAGTVMLWDAGICDVVGNHPAAALRQGNLVFNLNGSKLHGQWALVRMRPREDGDENAWLLIKTEDNAEAITARADDRSVLSGRTMKEIAGQRDRVWESNQNSRSARADTAQGPAQVVGPARRRALRCSPSPRRRRVSSNR